MTNALILRRHPFEQDPGIFPVRSGQTLGAMLREGAQGAELSQMMEVRIGGWQVPRKLWDKVTPKPGTEIQVTGTVAGRGGWRTVLMIVVMVVAWYIAPYLVGAYGAFAGASVGLVQAGLYMVGSLLVNALIPPPKPGGGSGGPQGQFNALTGTQNGINPYGPIPCVVGESRFYPPHAAMPYSQSVGEANYQYCMFDLGYGDIEVSDIRIGDTPIGDFDEVQYEITTTPTLYTSDVAETTVGSNLTDGVAVERTTAPGVDQISLDIVFPQGLFGVGTSGKDHHARIGFSIQYRAVGDTMWLSLPSPSLSGIRNKTIMIPGQFEILDLRKKPFAVGARWDVPNGQYEVRVIRYDEPGRPSDHTWVDTTQWTVLRSVVNTNPSTTGTNKLVMRIKATDQLNGTLQTLSCMVKQRIPVWDRNTDTWSDELTCNTAWVYHWLLTACPAFSTHVPDTRINLEQIADYADFCTTHELETRRVLDARSTARQVIDQILAGSLGALGTTNGQYSVVFDAGSTESTMSFTPKEAKNFACQRSFTRIPHALKVRFINPEANWEPDEIMVLDDGYSYRGVDARGNPSADSEPTTFETLDLQQACYAQQAWRLGRHHFAQAKFRPSSFGWETDIAGLGCTRGDVVEVTSDVTEWGAGAGVVIDVSGTTVTLDTEIETDPSKTYRAQVRRVTTEGAIMVSESYAVTPHSPVSATVYFDATPTLAVGDVVIIGETGRVTEKLILTGIRSAPDLGFSMMAVPYDSRVAPFWENPPAVIVSEITGKELESPDAPDVDAIVSDQLNGDRNDAGVYQPGIHIRFGGKHGFDRPGLEERMYAR